MVATLAAVVAVAILAGRPIDQNPSSSGALAGGSVASSSAGTLGSPPAASPTQAIPTPAPTPWTSLTWRPIGSREAVSDGGPNRFLTDAIAWGGGVVAVGYDFEPHRITGRIWRSLDGADWTEVTGDPPREGIAFDHVYSLGGRLVATGRDRTAELAGAQDDAGRPVAFESPDGITWTPVTAARSPWLGDADRQAASGGGVALVLERGSPDRLWRSTDGGDTWTSRPAGEPFGAAATVTDLAWTGSRWVAVGAVVSGTPHLDPGEPAGVAAAWTSPDGQRWTPAAVDAPGIGLGSIGVGANGLVAFGDAIVRGTNIRPSMRAFGSADGASWESIDLPNQWMRMVSDGTRIIVVDIGSDQPVRVRESFDGRTWSELPPLGVDARATDTGIEVDGHLVSGQPDLLAISGRGLWMTTRESRGGKDQLEVRWLADPVAAPGALPLPTLTPHQDVTCPNQEPCGP
jgi:hypothetical protein